MRIAIGTASEYASLRYMPVIGYGGFARNRHITYLDAQGPVEVVLDAATSIRCDDEARFSAMTPQGSNINYVIDWYGN